MKITINNPDLVKTNKVSKTGKIHVSKKLAGQTIRIIVEVLDEEEENDD